MAQVRFQQLERLAYWQGQELRSRDLRSQAGSLEQLRWWHNRAAHGVYGISQGSSVTVDPASPGMVNVACGLAYDCFGRELILPSPRSIPLPALTGARYLVAAYGRNSANLVWIALNDFRAFGGAPLALFRVDNGAYRKVDTFNPPLARALSRPRLGGGSTVPGNTLWELLPNDAGLQVVVDTSSAGFTNTPFYLTSLNWKIENTDFSSPIVSIASRSNTGFTLRLLLKDVGRELLAVVSGAGLFDTQGVPANSVHLRRRIGFGIGQNFQSQDLLARLAPRADLALPITAVNGQLLTLGASSTDWHPVKDYPVVLGSLPAVATIQQAAQALSVSNPATFPATAVILRMAGNSAGAAAKVNAQTPEEMLILESPLKDLAAAEQVALVSPAGTITVKGPNLFTLTPPVDLSSKPVVLRLSAQVDQEIPTTVSKVNPDGSFKLKTPIDGLADGETLGVAGSIGTVTSIGVALTVEAGKAKTFKAGGLVEIGASPALSRAILDSVDVAANRLVVRSFSGVPAGTIVAADFPVRSTVRARFGPFVVVGNTELFQPGDVVVRLTADGVSEASTLVPSPFPGVLQTQDSLPSLAAGDTLARARFARSATVKSVGTGSLPVAVQLNSAADAAIFNQGNTVAKLSSTAAMQLATVDHVTADTVFLRSAIATLGTGDTLAIITLNAVAVVIDPAPDATHLSVDDVTAASVGGVAARFTGWTDASPAVHVQTAGSPLQLDALPDGLMPGDVIGFAALSPAQPRIRFDASTSVGQQPLEIQGADENSGTLIDIPASISKVDNHLATILFNSVSAFALRPENLRITVGSRVSDFLAYAQRQGLYVCWLGCQMPAAEAPSCPGIVSAPCGCT